MISVTAHVSHQVCQFFVSSVPLLLRVTMVGKNKELRKLWDSLSELRSSLCERRLKRTVLRPTLLPVKPAQFTPFFRQVKSLSLTESV
jgi:hypothetical protein